MSQGHKQVAAAAGDGRGVHMCAGCCNDEINEGHQKLSWGRWLHRSSQEQADTRPRQGPSYTDRDTTAGDPAVPPHQQLSRWDDAPAPLITHHSDDIVLEPEPRP